MNVKPQNIKVYTGPNLIVPYKAVIVDYSHRVFGNKFTLSNVKIQKLITILPDVMHDRVIIHGVEDANALLVVLVKAFLDIRGPLDLEINVKPLDDGGWQLIIEYCNEVTAEMAVEASFLIISHIQSPLSMPSKRSLDKMHDLMLHLIMYAPPIIPQGMIAAAKKRKIPCYLIDNTSFLTSYGQGVKSVIFDYSASEYDSNLGFNLQRDKIKTNNFLRKIGYPATTQQVADSLEKCLEIVEKMGFPIVIKPQLEGQGRGVTANILTMEQVNYAYREAAKFSPKKVLIEKHIVGDVYRVTLSKGKVIGVGRRHRPQVIGDGQKTVRALIDVENIRRKEPAEMANKIKQIVLDDRLMQNLKNAKCNLESIPEAGKIILLGDIANRSAGGTLTTLEEKDMHPDYVDMTINLSKLFRLDSIGVDIITPDISCTWRELPGIVIEVNAYPMAAPDLTDKILGNYFSGNQGRIETTLVVSNDQNFSLKIFKGKQGEHTNAGYANNLFSIFRNGKLKIEEEGLYSRCFALLLNTDCDAIVVAITPDEIVKNGLPIDYFDNCIIDEECDLANADKAISNSTDVSCLKRWLEKYIGTINI